MRTRRVGERALLVECADSAEVAATYAALRARPDLGAIDIVPAARTVLVDGVTQVRDLEEVLRDLVPGAVPQGPGAGHVVIPVSYDGADLEEVARQWQVDTAEVVRIHTACEFVVAFCGFAPGFAYCTGLPPGLDVARRPEPRTRVPAGSVALAAEFTSVYPSTSPGGWQLIGRTDVPVWRPEEDPPALLAPGTRVSFREVAPSGTRVHGGPGA